MRRAQLVPQLGPSHIRHGRTDERARAGRLKRTGPLAAVPSPRPALTCEPRPAGRWRPPPALDSDERPPPHSEPARSELPPPRHSGPVTQRFIRATGSFLDGVGVHCKPAPGPPCRRFLFSLQGATQAILFSQLPTRQKFWRCVAPCAPISQSSALGISRTSSWSWWTHGFSLCAAGFLI